MEQYSGSNTVPDDERHEFLNRIWSTITREANNPLFGVSALASQLSISRSTLTRRILEVSGVSPSKLILQYRLQTAVKLLANTDLSIKEVSAMTGFFYESGFARAFKEEFGCSARQFRRDYTESLRTDNNYSWFQIYEQQLWDRWIQQINQHPWLQKVMGIVIRALVRGELSVDVLAEGLHMSKAQINKRCKALLNLHTRRFFLLVRLFYAWHLITSEKLTLTAATYEAGFCDQSHFRKVHRLVFKQETVPEFVLTQIGIWIEKAKQLPDAN